MIRCEHMAELSRRKDGYTHSGHVYRHAAKVIGELAERATRLESEVAELNATLETARSEYRKLLKATRETA